MSVVADLVVGGRLLLAHGVVEQRAVVRRLRLEEVLRRAVGHLEVAVRGDGARGAVGFRPRVALIPGLASLAVSNGQVVFVHVRDDHGGRLDATGNRLLLSRCGTLKWP